MGGSLGLKSGKTHGFEVELLEVVVPEFGGKTRANIDRRHGLNRSRREYIPSGIGSAASPIMGGKRCRRARRARLAQAVGRVQEAPSDGRYRLSVRRKRAPGSRRRSSTSSRPRRDSREGTQGPGRPDHRRRPEAREPSTTRRAVRYDRLRLPYPRTGERSKYTTMRAAWLPRDHDTS